MSRLRGISFTLPLFVFMLTAGVLFAQDRLASETRSARAVRERFDAVHAVGGRVFGVTEGSDGTIDVMWIPTSVPAAEAFGLSPDGLEVVYMPLVEDIATGELWREHLGTGKRSLVTPKNIVAAAVGPSEPFTVAFTHGIDQGFALAIVNLRTGVEASAPTPYVMPDLVRIDADGIVSYFEKDDPLLAVEGEPSLRAVAFNPSSAALNHPEKADGQPYLLSEDPVRRHIATDATAVSTAFAATSGLVDVVGDTLLGEAVLTAHDQKTRTATDLGSGVVLDMLRNGMVVRRFTASSSYVEYVTWSGNATLIGTNAELTFTLPLEKSILTRNGDGYSGRCGIPGISPHSGSKEKYAYDFQSSREAAILAVAPGSIVSVVDDITCNSADDKDCPTYTGKNCRSTWGNTVVYRLSDMSYIRTAHHAPNSFQSGATKGLCRGRYYAKQGSTGQSSGNAVDRCGAHEHIQRQTRADSDGTSREMYFSELSGAGKCGKEKDSDAPKVTSCPVTVLSENVESGASGWRNETVRGSAWGVERTSAAHSGGRVFRSNVDRSSYKNLTDASLVSPTFTLSGLRRAELTFWTVYRTEKGDDYFRVEASVNGGSWREVERYSGVSSSSNRWRQMSVSLDSYAGYAKVRVRFRLTSDLRNTDMGIVLDDIVITAR